MMGNNDEQVGFVNFEEMFGRPLSEVPDDEILAKAQELRTRRKYPSVDKAKAKKKDSVNDLIQSVLVNATKDKK
jgi:hypothetical protein